MLEWPIPNSVKKLRGFLDLTGNYRKFIYHYDIINKPLTDLLKKDSFKWSRKAQIAFEKLKLDISQAPVLG
jgi:hypothetical protein